MLLRYLCWGGLEGKEGREVGFVIRCMLVSWVLTREGFGGKLVALVVLPTFLPTCPVVRSFVRWLLERFKEISENGCNPKSSQKRFQACF